MKTKNRRQSKNVDDLRDKPPRPGAKPQATKAKKTHNTKSKLLKNGIESDVTTNKEPIKNQAPSSESGTFLANRFSNIRRLGTAGHKLGLKLKNMKLDSKPTSFKKDKKKK